MEKVKAPQIGSTWRTTAVSTLASAIKATIYLNKIIEITSIDLQQILKLMRNEDRLSVALIGK